jgi:3-oxoacyl-[acyl-carrier protein] reductase
MFTVRAVQPNVDATDERLTSVQKIDAQVARVFSGKIVTAIDAALQVCAIVADGWPIRDLNSLLLLEMMKQRIPFGRLATPDEVASVVTFLASPQGHWVTGQNIRANGGLV